MSELLAEFDEVEIAQFCGKNNTMCVQVYSTFGTGSYIHLDKLQTYQVVVELTKWLKDQAFRDKERIAKLIEENKLLEKTIYAEAVACEHYISDLKLIEIPIRLLELG